MCLYLWTKAISYTLSLNAKGITVTTVKLPDLVVFFIFTRGNLDQYLEGDSLPSWCIEQPLSWNVTLPQFIGSRRLVSEAPPWIFNCHSWKKQAPLIVYRPTCIITVKIVSMCIWNELAINYAHICTCISPRVKICMSFLVDWRL